MTYYAVGTTATTVPSSSSSRNGTAAQNSNSLPSFLASADGIDQVENNPYALALAFVPLMTIFGNALVILAVCRDKSLRTVTNLLIMSLAISDLLVALCVMFFAVYYEWNSFVWDLGPTLCNLYIGADVACSTASILNLLAISIDRYIAISHPLAYCQIGTNSRAYVSIALVWGVSISVAIPLAFGANHIESEHECAFTNPVFMISSSVLSFFLPCLAMIALYAVVFRRLRERESARTARKRHGALSGTETALIANALMGGARMARQIARSHLKDQLLLELSIQTSSFPTASRSEEEDEEEDEEDEYNDDDDEEEGTEPSESAGRRGAARRGHRRHNANSKGNNNSSSSSRRCLVTALQLHGQLAEEAQQQSRRPTIGLMMNGAMPFPMAPMNPLQLPSTAMTEAERRVRGWRRKRTLRLMRRCNTLPSTVMQRQNTTTTTPHQQGTTQMANARGESIDTEEHRDKQADATKCQKQVHRHQHHHQRGEPPTRPKSAMFNRGTDANGALRDAKDEGSGGAECVLHHQNTVDYVGENVLLQKHDATAEDVNAKEKKEAPKGGEVATTQHGRQSRCLPCPPSPTPIHLCNSFGDELKECFPFIDQSEQQQQQQKHKDHNNKCAFPPDAVGNCSTSAAEAFHDQQQSFSCCPFPLSSDEIRRCVVLPNTTTAEATDPSYSFHCAAFKRHHRNGKNGTARRTPEMTKEREKECHGNGQLVGHFGIRRTHSERHPANLTLRHRSKKQLIRQLSVDGRCTACAGWVAVVGRDDNNNRNNNFHYDNNNYHNESNNAPNWIGNNECANDTNAAVPSAMKSNMVTVQEAKETPPMAKDGAYSFDAALALCNGGRDTPLPQRQQQQEQKRRKQCGTMLARFIQWTRGQRRVIAEFGIGRGPRLVEVIESATTVGIISAVDHRNKSMGRGGGVRRSVRISSRSPPGRHANQRQNSTQRTTDDCCSVTHAVVAAATPADHYDDHSAHGHFGHGGEGDQEEGDVDQSPEEWNDAGGCDSSAALSSSYRLLLGSNNNCCRPDTDTDPRRDSGGSVMERFSTSRTGNGPYDDESLRNVQNGTVPRRNGGCCQRASTVTGVPPKKTSCASSTFSSSPLRYIRLAFRRSLVPIVEEGRKPSRALLKRATRQMRREQKATVTLAVVLAVFLCCWVPFFALHLSNAICLLSGGVQCVHQLATFLSTWLGFLNSSLNPLIYTVFDKRFRKAFRNLLGCTVAGPRSAVVATGGGRRGKRPRG